MEIFDHINNILFFKTPNKEYNIEKFTKYNPFLINRWISMYDGESAEIINQTTNKKNYFDNDKEMQYKMLLNIVPKKGYRKIDYIKKQIKEE